MSDLPGPISVLHVDDDPDVCRLVAAFLERHDERLNVTTMTDPTAVLDRLETEAFDCIVSDYDMPDRNGLELLEDVEGGTPELPFILFTGKGSEEIAARAIRAGVTDYIQKEGHEKYTVLANRVTHAAEQYQAERDARRTRRRLDEITEKTNDLLWMYSGNWEELLFVNSVYEELYGQSPERLREDPTAFLDCVESADRESVEAFMERVSSGHSADIEYRVRGDGGRMRWVWVQAEPIVEDGSVERIVGFSREITERKKRERRFEAVFNNTYQFTGLMEPDGTMIEANRTALSFGGLDRGDVVGKRLPETDWFEPYEESRRAAREAVETARDGEPTRHEIRIKGDDRDAIIDFSVRPVTDESGSDVLLVPEGRDITERKERERELRDEQGFVGQATDTLDDIFYFIGPNGKMRRWNEALVEVSGYSNAEIEGMNAAEFFPPDERDRIGEAIATTIETGSVSVTAEFRTKGDERIPYEFTGSRVDGEGGSVRGLVGIGRNLTDRREKERRFEAVFDDRTCSSDCSRRTERYWT